MACETDPDMFLVHWRRIAATAFNGFLLYGRGVVLMGPDMSVTYQTQPRLCECCAPVLATYNPLKTVVVLVGHDLFELMGWPTPEEAFAEVSSAESIAATVQ